MRNLEKKRTLLLAIAALLVIIDRSDVGSLATAQETVVVSPHWGNEKNPAAQQSSRGQRWPGASGARWRKGRGPIHEINVDITPGPGSVPAILKIEDSPRRSRGRLSARRNAETPIRFSWKSPGIYHYPLYFEDKALERQGRSPPLATLHSGIHFFANLAALPLHLARPILASPPSNDHQAHSTSRQR